METPNLKKLRDKIDSSRTSANVVYNHRPQRSESGKKHSSGTSTDKDGFIGCFGLAGGLLGAYIGAQIDIFSAIAGLLIGLFSTMIAAAILLKFWRIILTIIVIIVVLTLIL